MDDGRPDDQHANGKLTHPTSSQFLRTVRYEAQCGHICTYRSSQYFLVVSRFLEQRREHIQHPRTVVKNTDGNNDNNVRRPAERVLIADDGSVDSESSQAIVDQGPLERSPPMTMLPTELVMADGIDGSLTLVVLTVQVM